ncbi:MAG: hypothetical protein RLY70_1178 [Planctomycetota bacterium]
MFLANPPCQERHGGPVGGSLAAAIERRHWRSRDSYRPRAMIVDVATLDYRHLTLYFHRKTQNALPGGFNTSIEILGFAYDPCKTSVIIAKVALSIFFVRDPSHAFGHIRGFGNLCLRCFESECLPCQPSNGPGANRYRGGRIG